MFQARVVDIIYPEDNFHGLLRVRNLKSLIDVNLNVSTHKFLLIDN